MSSIDPRGLADGFSQHMDAEKEREYFQNNATETTTWSDPRKGIPRNKLIALKVGQRRKWELKMLNKAARRNQEIYEVRGRKPKITQEISLKPCEVREDYEKRLLALQEGWFVKKSALDEDKQRWFQEKQTSWREIQLSVEQSWSTKAVALRQDKLKLLAKQKKEMEEWEEEYLANMEKERKKKLDSQEVDLERLDRDQGKVKATMLAHREDGLRHLENSKIKAITQRLIQYRMELIDGIKNMEINAESLEKEFLAR